MDSSAASDADLSLRARVRRHRDDESGVTSTEMAVIMPVLIVLVMLPIHAALWWHAKQAVDLAAEEALEAAQIEGATEADGRAGAIAVLSAAGHVDNVQINVSIDALTEIVIVEIRGESGFQLVPGNWGVYARAEGRIEQFLGETER